MAHAKAGQPRHQPMSHVRQCAARVRVNAEAGLLSREGRQPIHKRGRERNLLLLRARERQQGGLAALLAGGPSKLLKLVGSHREKGGAVQRAALKRATSKHHGMLVRKGKA